MSRGPKSPKELADLRVAEALDLAMREARAAGVDALCIGLLHTDIAAELALYSKPFIRLAAKRGFTTICTEHDVGVNAQLDAAFASVPVSESDMRPGVLATAGIILQSHLPAGLNPTDDINKRNLAAFAIAEGMITARVNGVAYKAVDEIQAEGSRLLLHVKAQNGGQLPGGVDDVTFLNTISNEDFLCYRQEIDFRSDGPASMNVVTAINDAQQAKPDARVVVAFGAMHFAQEQAIDERLARVGKTTAKIIMVSNDAQRDAVAAILNDMRESGVAPNPPTLYLCADSGKFYSQDPSGKFVAMQPKEKFMAVRRADVTAARPATGTTPGEAPRATPGEDTNS